MLTVQVDRCCMPEPTSSDPAVSSDRLRETENDRVWQEAAGRSQFFRGFREVDRAILTDQVTRYSMTKMWSDPLARLFIFVGVTIILIGWTYLALQ